MRLQIHPERQNLNRIVPRAVLAIVDAVALIEPHDEGNVEVHEHGAYKIIICGPLLDWHDDESIADLTALLVLRNDARSYVQAKGDPVTLDQPPGTLLLLDLRKDHRLHNPIPRPGVWAALAIDYHVRSLHGRDKYAIEPELFPDGMLLDEPPTIDGALAHILAAIHNQETA